MSTDSSAPLFRTADIGWAVAAVALSAVVVAAPQKLTLAFVAAVALVAIVVASARRTEFLAAALVATAALDVVGRLGKVAGVTVTVFQAVLVLSFFVTIWLLVTGRAVFRASWADPFIVLMALAALFTFPAALEPKAALVALVSLYSSIAVSYFIRIFAPSREQIAFLLLTLLVISAVLGVAAVAERREIFVLQDTPFSTEVDGIRARVTFDDPNLLGGLLAAAAAASIPLLVTSRNVLKIGFIGACALASLAGMVMTLSRGAWLGFVAGAVVAVLFAPVRAWLKIALFAVGGVGAAFLAIYVLDPTWIAMKVTGIFGNASALQRVFLLETGVEIFKRYPFGVGPGMFGPNAEMFRSQFLRPDLANSHTALLTVLVELGLTGFIGFVGALGVWAWQMLKTSVRGAELQDRVLASAILAGGATILVQSLTYSLEGSKFLWFFIGAGLAVVTAARASVSLPKESS